mgnify:FL=1
MAHLTHELGLQGLDFTIGAQVVRSCDGVNIPGQLRMSMYLRQGRHSAESVKGACALLSTVKHAMARTGVVTRPVATSCPGPEMGKPLLSKRLARAHPRILLER